MDSKGNIGELKKEKIAKQQQRDPETFLTRLSIIAEGATEVGLASFLLERGVSGELLSHGVRVCDGQGTPAVLDLLDALSDGGLAFGGFVDASNEKPDKWKTLHGKLGALLFQWPSGCTEERIIALVDDDKLLELLKGRDGKIDFDRRNTLADRLGLTDKSMGAILAKTTNFKALIIAAASGNSEGAPDPDTAKTWKKHSSAWFKSEDGGRELAEKMMALSVWPKLRPTLLPFINAVRAQVGQAEITDLLR
jgi:putative ATP-dependent endonuclease of OLD family